MKRGQKKTTPAQQHSNVVEFIPPSTFFWPPTTFSTCWGEEKNRLCLFFFSSRHSLLLLIVPIEQWKKKKGGRGGTKCWSFSPTIFLAPCERGPNACCYMDIAPLGLTLTPPWGSKLWHPLPHFPTFFGKCSCFFLLLDVKKPPTFDHVLLTCFPSSLYIILKK